MLPSFPPAPYALFETWHRAAEEHEHIRYAGAMCLSTVAADGGPDGRIVLLHAADAGCGFAFFTDVRSTKGRALADDPRVALTFYWGPLERQVRVQGRAALSSEAEADRFFEKRPRRSRLTAWASEQSRPLSEDVTAAAALEEQMAALRERFAGRASIPRPPHWKAYRVRPRRVAFWEAKAQRLHTRVEYARDADAASGWTKRRLAP
jgi:pyridoxamine 5'-phosphate oxidase